MLNDGIHRAEGFDRDARASESDVCRNGRKMARSGHSPRASPVTTYGVVGHGCCRRRARTWPCSSEELYRPHPAKAA